MKRPTKAFRRYLLLRSITLQETESPFSHRFVVTRSIGRFRVPKNLTFKARLSAKALIWKWFLIMMQIKVIFTAKVFHLASFWKWDFLELGNGLFISTFPEIVPNVSPLPVRWRRETLGTRLNLLDQFGDITSQSKGQIPLKLRFYGQQKRATCFATLLHNELKSDVVRFTNRVQTW